MIVRDWRNVPAEVLRPMFDRERRHWLSALRWDPDRDHAQIELARTTWGLPGLVAVDASDSVHGLAFFLEAGGRLEIGGIIADTPDVTGALLDGVIDHAVLSRTAGVFCFSYAKAAGLAQQLTRRGFHVDPFIYYERILAGMPDAVYTGADGTPLPVTRPWQMDDIDATAALLQRAFEPQEGAYFAPGHTVEAWQHYVRNLVQFGACGVLNADASRCAPLGNGLGAVTLVTTISDATAHIVQVAVDPACRGWRLARRLVGESCLAAREQGKTSVTLMVAARNGRARDLYAELGFAERATFVAATRPIPFD